MVFHPRRALVLALAASLTAHAVLLFGVVRARPPRLFAPAVRIEVVALGRTGSPQAQAVGKPPPEERAEPVAVEEAPPRRADPPNPARAAGTDRRKTAPAPSRTKNVLARRTDPVVAPSASLPPAAEAAAASAMLPAPAESARAGIAGVAGAAAGEAAAPGPAASSVPGSAREDEAGAGELGRYRSALAANARRFKRYPPLARERGWEGSVAISLDFRRSGEPVLSLLVSSGKEILDEQALETLRLAVDRTELPESLRGRDFRIRQEFVFRLEDER
jgi:protein TonB